jgi:hypothetical protein
MQGYNPHSVLHQGTLQKLCPTPDGQSQYWDARVVVLTPKALQLYRPGLLSPGTAPKSHMLLAGGRLELVGEGEIEVWRDFTFSFISAASNSETVLSAGSSAECRVWLESTGRAIALATYAAERGLEVTMRGELVSSDGLVRVQAAEVFAAAAASAALQTAAAAAA